MPDPAAIPDPAVNAVSVSRSFSEGERRHTVLRDAELCVAAGESVAVRGRSGSGKSTLLNLLAGIDTPDNGSISVAGIELTALNDRQRTLFRRRHIGFVYQSFHLLPTLSVADNVRLVLELNGRRDADARVAELLDAVGLGDRGHSAPDVLSGGEQQRVAIARALAHEPALLIGDEPTGNLDDTTAESVITLLSQLVRERGATMILATHSQRVAEICDRQLELAGGQLRAV